MSEEIKKKGELFANNPIFLANLLGFDKLEHELHEDWIKRIYRKGNDTLLAHRNSYKTTCTIVGVVILLMIKPNTTILINRKTDAKSKEFADQLDKIYSSEIMYEIYEQNPKSKNWGKERGFTLITNESNEKEPNITFSSIHKTSTGSHYDLIINDDVTTKEDRYYSVEREKTKKSYIEQFNLLKVDSIGIKDSGTVWHEDDLLSKRDVTRYTLDDNIIPEFDETKINELRKNIGSESLFQANYYLRHISDDKSMFPDIHRTKISPKQYTCTAYIDPAFSSEGDYTAITVGLNHKIDNEQCYIIDGYAFRVSADNLISQIHKILSQYTLNRVYVESNQAQILLVSRLRELNHNAVKTFNKSNKMDRIISSVGREYSKIRFNHIDNAYERQVINFNDVQNDYDDAVDSLSGFILKTKQIQTLVIGG